MKTKFIDYYISIAERTAELSYGKRLKVGAIIVKDNRIISIGYNGSISGDSNELEHHVTLTVEEYLNLPESEKSRYVLNDRYVYEGLKTKDGIIHAEKNAILKLAQSTESAKDSILFLTHSPCLECSTLILLAGIKEVYYKEDYRLDDGINFLKQHGVQVIKYDKNVQTNNI